MKCAKPSTGTSKGPRSEASISSPASSDQPTVEEIPMDLTATVDPTIDPTIAPPLSLHAMMETFMTTQVAHGQLVDELIIEVAILSTHFVEYRSAFPPLPPFDP